MATYSKTILSGSTDGKGIKLTTTTSTSAATIHTGSSTASTLHEVWLWAMNTTTSGVKVTVGWGGTTDPDNLLEYTAAGEDGLKCIVPGLILKGNATPLVITAWAASANVVMIYGYVNVIT